MGHPESVGSRYSKFSKRNFHYGVCRSCDLGLVLDPRTDYDALYSPEYYSGNGADPLVEYSLLSEDRARRLEFTGLEKVGRTLVPEGAPLRWLDFGAGLGSFTEFLRQQGWDAWGIDDGYAHEVLEHQGLAWTKDAAPFTVISAIEVVEHLVDPLPTLAFIASLLASDGTFFVTTGNFSKHRTRLTRWSYAAHPEVHVTFWSPEAWKSALSAVGMAPGPVTVLDPSVTQYKVIKSLKLLKWPLTRWARYWRWAAKVVDRRYGVSEFSSGLSESAGRA
jgi:2-polyprenyl-3-methyl-5-hydroxy-6-metoxy-1,4-benzoquinol methylase